MLEGRLGHSGIGENTAATVGCNNEIALKNHLLFSAILRTGQVGAEIDSVRDIETTYYLKKLLLFRLLPRTSRTNRHTSFAKFHLS